MAANRSVNTCGRVSSDGPVSKVNPSRRYSPSFPPWVAARSCTATRWPCAASRAAAARPPTPAPITTTRATSAPAAAPDASPSSAPHPRPASPFHVAPRRWPRHDDASSPSSAATETGWASASGHARPPRWAAASTTGSPPRRRSRPARPGTRAGPRGAARGRPARAARATAADARAGPNAAQSDFGTRRAGPPSRRTCGTRRGRRRRRRRSRPPERLTAPGHREVVEHLRGDAGEPACPRRARRRRRRGTGRWRRTGPAARTARPGAGAATPSTTTAAAAAPAGRRRRRAGAATARAGRARRRATPRPRPRPRAAPASRRRRRTPARSRGPRPRAGRRRAASREAARGRRAAEGAAARGSPPATRRTTSPVPSVEPSSRTRNSRSATPRWASSAARVGQTRCASSRTGSATVTGSVDGRGVDGGLAQPPEVDGLVQRAEHREAPTPRARAPAPRRRSPRRTRVAVRDTASGSARGTAEDPGSTRHPGEPRSVRRTGSPPALPPRPSDRGPDVPSHRRPAAPRGAPGDPGPQRRRCACCCRGGWSVRRCSSRSSTRWWPTRCAPRSPWPRCPALVDTLSEEHRTLRKWAVPRRSRIKRFPRKSVRC